MIYPISKMRIGKRGPHISAVHTKPSLMTRFNPPAEHITPPIWLHSELQPQEYTYTVSTTSHPTQNVNTSSTAGTSSSLKRPPPDTDVDVQMNEQILVVVDVAVVLVDVATEISEEIFLEIPTLGALAVRFRDKLPPIVI